MSNILSKAEILSAADLKTETIEVPEWGGAIIVRTMTGADRAAFQEAIGSTDAAGNRQTNLHNILAKLCAITLVDEVGNRLFDESDIDLLAGKNGMVLDRVSAVVLRLNGMAADSLGEAEKNSAAAPSGASSSS